MPRDMTSYRDFETIRIQAVAFFPKAELQPTKVIALLLSEFADRFDGDLQSIGLPLEIPSEIPRAILQSNDLQYRFEVSPGRLSSQWQSQGTAHLSLSNAVGDCVEVLNACIKTAEPEIGRLALVISRSCSCEEPSQTLIRRFCTEEAQLEPFNRSMNFEIHNHKQYAFPKFDPELMVNSWVRCKTAVSSPPDTKGILVEQDMNTRVEDSESRQFDTPEMVSFFDIAVEEANRILEKYFPERNNDATC